MISEEDKKLIEEAKTCDNCLCWHKHCQAECCKMVLLNTSPDELDSGKKFIILKTHKTKDDIWYYRMRDVSYHFGYLHFLRERCCLIDNKVFYIHPCNALDGCLCKLHGKRKPKLCEDFTLETAQNPKDIGAALTKHCLFRYKIMEV